MASLLRTSLVVACASLLWGAILHTTAVGAPITAVKGTYDGIRPISGFQNSSFTFTDNDPSCEMGPGPFTNCFGTATFNPGTLLSLTSSELAIHLGTFTAPNAAGVSFPSSIVVSDGLHQATFTLSHGQLFINGLTGTITATVNMTQNTFPKTVADLSLFSGGGTGTFTATYSNILVSTPSEIPGPGSPIRLQSVGDSAVATWDNDPNSVDFAAISGNYVITPGQVGVPEPASMVLWSLAGLAGAGWLRRRWSRTA
jgi:hypothetical protein